MLIQSMSPAEIADEAKKEFQKYFPIVLKAYRHKSTIKKFKTTKNNNLTIVIGNKHIFYAYFSYETTKGRELVILDMLDSGKHIYILCPHFIQRFQERLDNCSFDAVPKRFMNELWEGDFLNIDKDFITLTRYGICHCVDFGDHIYLFKTIISQETLTNKQIDKIECAIKEKYNIQ